LLASLSHFKWTRGVKTKNYFSVLRTFDAAPKCWVIKTYSLGLIQTFFAYSVRTWYCIAFSMGFLTLFTLRVQLTPSANLRCSVYVEGLNLLWRISISIFALCKVKSDLAPNQFFSDSLIAQNSGYWSSRQRNSLQAMMFLHKFCYPNSNVLKTPETF
jgi:hypothetical protein